MSIINNAISQILDRKEATHHGQPLDIKIGDDVTFKALTSLSNQKATRKVREVLDSGRVVVRFGGGDSFQVRPHEIISIKRKG